MMAAPAPACCTLPPWAVENERVMIIRTGTRGTVKSVDHVSGEVRIHWDSGQLEKMNGFNPSHLALIGAAQLLGKRRR